jgi:myo-inositol-1(or 4)-monophosphatase
MCFSILPKELQELLTIGSEIACQAAAFLQKNHLDSRMVESKTAKDVKIRADRLLSRFISERLTQRSGLPVISEESDKNFDLLESDRPFWVIDPLDGSMNFTRDLELGCISIALCEGRNPILGIIYDFYRHKMYCGGEELGAWMNNCPIHVSKTDQPEQAILATGFPVRSDFSQNSVSQFVASVQAFMKIRMLGTAALSLAWVASGFMDAYYERDIMIWDVAAGLALVRAAGGAFRIDTGRYPRSLHVIATNRELLPTVEALHGFI